MVNKRYKLFVHNGFESTDAPVPGALGRFYHNLKHVVVPVTGGLAHRPNTSKFFLLLNLGFQRVCMAANSNFSLK